MGTKKELQEYEYHIRKAINGFIVNVGCTGPIIFMNWNDLRKELDGIFSDVALGPVAQMVLKNRKEECGGGSVEQPWSMASSSNVSAPTQSM